jgi:hypothetical protein
VHAAGMALRLRKGNGKVVQSVKAPHVASALGFAVIRSEQFACASVAFSFKSDQSGKVSKKDPRNRHAPLRI